MRSRPVAESFAEHLFLFAAHLWHLQQLEPTASVGKHQAYLAMMTLELRPVGLTYTRLWHFPRLSGPRSHHGTPVASRTARGNCVGRETPGVSRQDDPRIVSCAAHLHPTMSFSKALGLPLSSLELLCTSPVPNAIPQAVIKSRGDIFVVISNFMVEEGQNCHRSIYS